MHSSDGEENITQMPNEDRSRWVTDQPVTTILSDQLAVIPRKGECITLTKHRDFNNFKMVLKLKFAIG